MSCNSSIAFVRVPFVESLTIRDIAEIMKKIEDSTTVDEFNGVIEYISVDESKASFRPRLIKDRWYLERIIAYNYEEFGDLDISMTEADLNGYVNELLMIGGVWPHWEFKVHVWYNGCDEPE